MIEKRFEVDNLKIQDTAPKGRLYLLDKQGGVNALCSLINGLNDKSNRLEKENEGLNAKNKVLYKEIERLKIQNKDLLYSNAKNIELLEKENEQLKSDNNRLVNETAKIVAEHQKRVLDLIDEKIKEYQKYDGYDTEKYYIGIQLLNELKKEL